MAQVVVVDKNVCVECELCEDVYPTNAIRLIGT